VIKEIVYINGGEVYSEFHGFDLRDGNKRYAYKTSEDAEVQVIEKTEQGDKKNYTIHLRENDKEFRLKTLADFDLCPKVSRWIAHGAYDKKDECDLYFAVESSKMLNAVSEYYGLPSPLNDELSDAVDRRGDEVRWRRLHNKNIIGGAVKFGAKKRPILMKLYIYPNEWGLWGTYMNGTAYYNYGEIEEEGGIYHKDIGMNEEKAHLVRGQEWERYAESVVSEKQNGDAIQYIYDGNTDDPLPLAYWYGEEVASNGRKRIRRFETSRQMRELICNLPTGHNNERYDRCPDIQFWLGRSWYENENVSEIYFMAEDSDMVDKVSAYYGLPVPYDDALKIRLNNDPASMRVRHYDINQAGEGHHIPVVACGVEFEGKVPLKVKLYAFERA